MKTKEELAIYKREWARKKRGSTEKSLNNSQTWKGRKSELIALNILNGAIDQNKDIMNKSFDLLYKGKKIDVKSCNLYKRKNKRGIPVKSEQAGCWIFNKNKGYSDKYFCICLIKDIPVRYYLIPKEIFNKGITIGHCSKKFDKYLIKKTL